LNGFEKFLTLRTIELRIELNTFKYVQQKEDRQMFIVSAYFVYAVISLSVTIWVARTLRRRGRVFLVDAFHGQEEVADSVNHLLVVGFYLINVGYVAFALKSTENPLNLRQAIELVSDKIGLVLLILGLMHFFNLYVFSRIRKRAKQAQTPPVPPAPLMPTAPQMS